MAKRFRFQLDPVLKYRERLEDSAKNAFGEAQGRVLLQQRSIDGLNTAQTDEYDSIAGLIRQNASVTRISDSYRFLAAIDVQRAHEEHMLHVLQEEAERKRLAYVETRKQRRALDLLRDKRREEHRAATDREEQQALDELALQRFNRQRKDG